MAGLLDQLPDEEKAKLRESAQPSWVQPMLAKLTHHRFSSEDWVFERKLDGQRCIAFRRRDRVRLMSRNRKDIGSQYPELVASIAAQKADDFVVDGEIVAFEGDLTSFSRLQERMHVLDPSPSLLSRVAVKYYLFDLVHLDGRDTTRVGLRHRKVLLKGALSFDDPLRFTAHRNAEGMTYFREACRKGWEGVIAKRADSPYQHSRSGDWLKFKCVNEQEFVVGGYTDPQRSRLGFGALLVGYYDDGKLVYAGKVGTGYDDDTLRRLGDILSSLERTTAPFDRGDPPTRGVHWVTPDIVAQVGFTEWTDDGRLRHPVFLGVRPDKDPRDVVREKPEA